jgi:glucose/arabinose dehydrogenase
MTVTTPSLPTRLRVALVAAGLLAGIVPSPAAAAIRTTPLTDGGATPSLTSASIGLRTLVTGLDDPVYITSAKDGTGRMFIVEQGGRVLVRKDGAVLPQPFLDIRAYVTTGSEQGLLGLAFHPSFETNRRFYVNYTNRNGNTVIREYRASTSNPDRVESGSGRTILKVVQPYTNHNGGMIEFGPDGYLYIGMGDGGSANDPGNRAQRLDTLLGKMLRIDVNGTTSTRAYRIPASNPYVGRSGLNEIWQRGLRNPWRFSFDRANGNLMIADVGQGSKEEINRATRTSSGPGRAWNFGWRRMEGRGCNAVYDRTCSTSGLRLPFYQYSHLDGRCSITGGYVYRGSAIPALVGWYVFADFCSGEIFAVRANASYPTSRVRLRDTSGNITSFGENAAGELYVVTRQGTIHLIAPPG